MALFGKREKETDVNGTPTFVKEPVTDESGAVLIAQKTTVGKEDVLKAIEALKKYKVGKKNLETRIIDDEKWYKLRHWEAIRKGNQNETPEPASAWLFNGILNKHADAMDNSPQPNVLPREQSDKESAQIISEILPVILERCEFEGTYSDNWWEKLKHGTSVYGVFWNKELENGLGDVEVKDIDLLNIFWQPGIKKIQSSRYLFIVDLVDDDILKAEYPQLKNISGDRTIEVAEYNYDDEVDVSDKSLVIDCYYKKKLLDGRTVVHLMKICGEELLFASENDDRYIDGYYEDGQYPVVFDTLFPEKGTPVGFGYVALCKDPQLYIDKLSGNILETSMIATKTRFLASQNCAINKKQLLDINEPIVEVAGQSLDDSRIKEINVKGVDGVYLNILQMKIDEMKETSANRDVSSGGVGGGVTSAAGISALQEAGSKSSRDMIAASYRNYAKVIEMVIERMRQFYDEVRTFRIINADYNVPGAESEKFVDFSNAMIKAQPVAPAYAGGEMMFRKPIFDIKIKAEKKNPFSQLTMNEMAKELYAAGAFNPQRAQEAMIMLDMMEFEGIDEVRAKIAQGQTLYSTLQTVATERDRLAQIVQMVTGKDMGIGGNMGGQGAPAPRGNAGGSTVASRAVDSQKAAMTPYGERLARRAVPDMETVESGAMPR